MGEALPVSHCHDLRRTLTANNVAIKLLEINVPVAERLRVGGYSAYRSESPSVIH